MPSRPVTRADRQTKEAIEQMLAMGRSDDYIQARGFTLAQIGLVEAGMDEANSVETRPAAAGAYGRNTE